MKLCLVTCGKFLGLRTDEELLISTAGFFSPLPSDVSGDSVISIHIQDSHFESQNSISDNLNQDQANGLFNN